MKDEGGSSLIEGGENAKKGKKWRQRKKKAKLKGVKSYQV